MSDNKVDTPDTPPEILAAQAKSRALTPATAELIQAKEYVNDAGRLVSTVASASPRTPSELAAQKARKLAEGYMGGEPLRGLSTEEHAKMRGKAYPGAPRMDLSLGDRTLAFVNWLWATHPADAKIRYAYRDIWPSVLPANWPPKPSASPASAKPKAKGWPKGKPRAAKSSPAPTTPAITTP